MRRSSCSGAGRRHPLLLALPLLLGHQDEPIGTRSLAEIATCFVELEQALARDGGRLWGIAVSGPVLIVDPLTRRVAANRPDPAGLLLERQGVFVGTLPKDKPLANAPLEWSGVRWAMAMESFLGTTTAEHVNVLAHEAFHCVQKDLGLYVFGAENEHLDTPEGRLWLQLEWNALQAAFALEREARRAPLQDALDFRAARRARFPGAAESENALELREGLASYTGLVLSGRTAAELPAHIEGRRAKEDGFVRSFAYFSGPLYGYLLDQALAGSQPPWRARLDGKSDLGALLGAALGLEGLAERATGRAAAHDGEALRTREDERERARRARLATWRTELVEGPVLVLDLALVTAGTMDTRKVHVFEPGKLVYTARKLSAAWGTLEVDGGAILEEAATRLGRVSLRGAASDHCSGAGWELVLQPGWEHVPGARAGDLALRPPP